MITKEDYLSYISEIEIIERNMRDVYKLALENIHDPDLRNTFEALFKAEKQHAIITSELRQLIIKKLIK